MADGQLAPGDESWPADRALLSELTPVIAQLSQYVMRFFDAEAGQAEALSVADERALAKQVAGVAAKLQGRAERRAILGSLPGTVEGRAVTPAALDPSPDMDIGP